MLLSLVASDQTAMKSRLPKRTTKLNEKLVTLPVSESPSVQDGLQAQQPGLSLEDARSDVERMGYDDREAVRLPRVTGYCSCEGYHLDNLSSWIKTRHCSTTTKYDEALYVKYTQPFPVQPPPQLGPLACPPRK